MVNKITFSQIVKEELVSEVVLSDNDEIKALHHEGNKCARCWSYGSDYLKISEEEYLCPRCHEVVKKYGQD